LEEQIGQEGHLLAVLGIALAKLQAPSVHHAKQK